MSIGNRTLKYLGISMQTLPEIQECLKVILDKKPKDYMGIYINDSQYIAVDESDNYLFLKVSEKACDYIVSKAEEFVIDYYKDIDGINMIIVVEPKIGNPEWKKNFANGHYSKIYDADQLYKFKLDGDTPFQVSRNAVLKKKEEYWDEFKQILDKEYGGIRMDEEYDGRELDLPPRLSEEILNYKKI